MRNGDDRCAVRLSGVTFGWSRDRFVLDVAAFEILRAERVLLSGASGSGKSTLLSVLSGVMTPTSGSISILGEELTTMSGARRDAFRAAHLGVIFQTFNLVPYLSALENVLLPCRFSNARRKRAEQQEGAAESAARSLLSRLGLTNAADITRSSQRLSIGQQQRVAAARALIGSPAFVLADEPTSALDWETRDSFLSILKEECDRCQATLLFVSHDPTLAPHFDRTVDLSSINAAISEREAQ